MLIILSYNQLKVNKKTHRDTTSLASVMPLDLLRHRRETRSSVANIHHVVQRVVIQNREASAPICAKCRTHSFPPATAAQQY
jgi:hypothetical protein